MSRTKKIIIASSLIVLVLALTFFALIFWSYVLEPAYMSYVGICVPQGQEIIAQSGYVMAGAFDPQNETIILVPELADDRTVRHEQCHQWQYNHGLLVGCDNKVRYIANEINCYIWEYL